jgi:hypothetical protein
MEYRLRASGKDPVDPLDCTCLVADYCFDEDEDGLCDCDEDEEEGSCCQDEDGDNLCDCIDEDEDGICDAANYTDSDGDGLNDCEERYTGTNRSGADSDGDGFLDFTEVRFGTSPDIDDVADDMDWDFVANGEEIRTATDPGASSTVRSKLAYRYTLSEQPTLNDARTCYDFEINNISLVELIDGTDEDKMVGPAGQGYSRSNRIMIRIGEVPFDDPETYARYRVACVEGRFLREGNYKNPPDGKFVLDDEDFVELSEFNAEEHCLPPGGR